MTLAEFIAERYCELAQVLANDPGNQPQADLLAVLYKGWLTDFIQRAIDDYDKELAAQDYMKGEG